MRGVSPSPLPQCHPPVWGWRRVQGPLGGTDRAWAATQKFRDDRRPFGQLAKVPAVSFADSWLAAQIRCGIWPGTSGTAMSTINRPRWLVPVGDPLVATVDAVQAMGCSPRATTCKKSLELFADSQG
ncbi:hypothetical protein G7Z17_g11922 [Cylindrodendrum hubeiense]|uniref:Uncharacterized protein n=1 Tax=Cylindrodendrum hubeiense TaxID=595255 RepID=A0A9P5L3J1_9HYPO|nr:hypothetical protein G7Z17_g11922 [Cylindrodendrum hubeiense]